MSNKVLLSLFSQSFHLNSKGAPPVAVIFLKKTFISASRILTVYDALANSTLDD